MLPVLETRFLRFRVVTPWLFSLSDTHSTNPAVSTGFGEWYVTPGNGANPVAMFLACVCFWAKRWHSRANFSTTRVSVRDPAT